MAKKTKPKLRNCAACGAKKIVVSERGLWNDKSGAYRQFDRFLGLIRLGSLLQSLWDHIP